MVNGSGCLQVPFKISVFLFVCLLRNHDRNLTFVGLRLVNETQKNISCAMTDTHIPSQNATVVYNRL